MTNFDNQFTRQGQRLLTWIPAALKLNGDGTCEAPVQPPGCTELNAKVSIPAKTMPTRSVFAQYIARLTILVEHVRALISTIAA